MKNIQVLLAARPSGRVEGSHFSLVESDIPKAFIAPLNGQNFGKQLVKLI